MSFTKIMIVEDNTTVSEDCRDCLENLGYGVTSIVASGEESIERAEKERPDAVLMDIHLRDEMDGIEAAEQLYSRFKIPVVFLSAYSDIELLERAKQVGSFGYLLKPFNERELYAMIETAVYKARVEKKQRQMEARLRQTQKMEAVSILAGGIAHQLNNALYAIRGNIDLLEMDFIGNERIADYTRKIEASARGMAQLVAQLTAYARGGKYQIKKLSLNDCIRNTLPLIKHTIDHEIDVDTELSRDILNIKADLAQMQMLLYAILINASEAMNGKGSIRIACKNIILTDKDVKKFSGLKPGKYVTLTVTDNGKGMNKETRNRIFEPFFTTKFEGRGLGMAAAYGIVRNHDGWISVDSEPGHGTIVKIYLPATEVQIQEVTRLKIEPIKGTGTILIIEDEEMVMAVLRAMLERLNYHVLEAKTGLEAINVTKDYEGTIDLAMLDILMPDMSGNTIYPFLMEARPNLKVIVCSGYSIDGQAEKIIDAGAQDFLQKPFSFAALSEKLNKVLEG
ncbi:MAG: response regulator [Sulfurospirillum sp.]|nr:response regulator [Sulfurospirillum sp.]